jgi:hypothetical protein
VFNAGTKGASRSLRSPCRALCVLHRTQLGSLSFFDHAFQLLHFSNWRGEFAFTNGTESLLVESNVCFSYLNQLANSGSNSASHGDSAAAEALTTSDRVSKFFVANAWDLIVSPPPDKFRSLIGVLSACDLCSLILDS